MMLGSRSPWWLLALAALTTFFVTLTFFSGPQEKLASITSNALIKVCDNNQHSPLIVTVTRTVHTPQQTIDPSYDTETEEIPELESESPPASQAPQETQSQSSHYSAKTQYTAADKPPVPVIALVFAGRRANLEILDCYLRRNLAKNGGWLDGAQWIIKTDNKEDIAFIEKLIEEVPEYTGRRIPTISWAYAAAYAKLSRDTIYVKIDDDVVFFEDHTIPTIVTQLHENKQFSVVSANMMNHALMTWVHYHTGAIRPYLPEMEKPEGWSEKAPAKDWRTSTTPQWSGNIEEDVPGDLEHPPYNNHKWLRVPKESDIERTPAAMLSDNGNEYNPNGKAWASWAVAAQQHYSFFENLEANELWRYRFDVWNFHAVRMSINFITFYGDLLIDNPFTEGDDEQYLTVELPKKIGRPAVMAGGGLANHFSYFTQNEGMKATDVLSRYHLFAQQNICGKRWGTEWEL